jgi:hypothetical protein
MHIHIDLLEVGLAKKSIIARAQREPKFKVRKYNRCPLWALTGVYQEVWGLSDLFQKAGVKRRDNRSDEIKLVALFHG